MSKQLSDHAAAAKMIRQKLKKNGIPAKVRSDSYSGGSSITVTVFADLMPKAVEEIKAYISQYEYGHFDGMQDLYEYSNSRDDIPQVKFVFLEVEYSEEIKAESRAYIEEINGIEGYEKDQYAWMALSGSWGDFWTSRKPHVRAAA